MTWKQQLANSYITPDQLAARFGVDPEPLRRVASRYPLRITPYFLDLIEAAGDPLWRQCVPDPAELTADDWPEDSMNEAAFAPVPAIVHRYPDRVLLLVHGQCASYCRFCTRKSRVGQPGFGFSAAEIDAGIDYIAGQPGIRDVILTGGDPLLLDDEILGVILARLRAIEHVEILRIGTRVPATLPMRITPELCRLLADVSPLYLNTHFNHPLEITAASAQACALLADAGVVLGNQTVLLRGVNDDAQVMMALNRGLLRMRVRPYYLHQLDRAKGTGHFRVPVTRGLEIVRTMRGQVSGLGIPHYVMDPPSGCGKVPLDADFPQED